MTVRSTNHDVNRFLVRTREGLSGLRDKDLELALKSAAELVKLEAESTKTLREADISQAVQRGSRAERASALLVMAYLGAKYPQLAGMMGAGGSPSKSTIAELGNDLTKQFDQLLQSRLPKAVLKDLKRFVSPTEMTGINPCDLIGSHRFATSDKTVRVEKNVVSVEGPSGLLVFTPGERGTFEVTLSKKEVRGYGAPKRVDLSAWSAESLDRLASMLRSKQGETHQPIDDLSATLCAQARVTRREIQKTNNTASDELVSALDSFFAAAREQIGGRKQKAAMCLDTIETHRVLDKFFSVGRPVTVYDPRREEPKGLGSTP